MEKIAVEVILGEGFAVDEVTLAAEFGLKIGLLILQDQAAGRLIFERDARPRRTYYDLSLLSISYFALCFRPSILYLLSYFK